ncbi:MAG: hypothetical protein ASARMPRED_002985 [Alectoria sarmentosa]|nr:MAG: hypothetical protein ASARMPRED_002985 [Alectoria sarmentosa]
MESSKKKATFSGRSFLSRALTRRDAGDQPSEDGKGPFGLNTLFEPEILAIADLVFVHGLGGGSKSTWTKSNDPSLYWPKAWLPQDPGFQDVRIHSFGYNSNWGDESILNIHDFAKALLGSLQDCPLIPRNTSAPLILIGHSMGGLVIKRAYIMARQKDGYENLSQRVKAMFFLATPHRGSDLAQLLTKVLNVSPGARPFVKDLHRNSLATQSINEEFPQYCQDLRLYSFYETLPMAYGLGKSIVVEKDAAVLGYPNEQSAYLNANHREVCKYADQKDSNYQTVRNALTSAIDKLRASNISIKHEVNNEQRRRLDGCLGVSDAPEDEFMDIDALRLRGSCEWLMRKRSFQVWRDSATAQFYWISAKPATGKTVLSGKVVHHLKDLNRDIAFFFFDYRNKAQTTISSFLLSMAAQMAHMHTEVLQTVIEICEKDDQLCKADYRTIWRKLLVEGILRIRFARAQYWVIDALDECKNGSDLVPFLLKIIENRSNIHILLTSRERFEFHRQAIYPKVKVVQEEILPEDTQSDIELYLDANLDQLPLIEEEDEVDVASKILEKSAGCFLWVSLILQELRLVHTSNEIRQVLEEVPSDMNALYSRILDSMSKAPPYGKVLARAILTWVVCCSRPLTTSELYQALQIDIKDKIDNIKASIESRCGQLVYVDAQSRVQMVHQTARDFLLQASGFSEFGVEEVPGHRRVFMTCLEYLSGNEMRSPKRRKFNLSSIARERGPFVNYACNEFFEHVVHLSSQDDEAFAVLTKLLSSTNILSCIEYIAQYSDLSRLIQAGKAFKKFLQRRLKHSTPVGQEFVLLDCWATDLIRLVAKFGKDIKASPSSIYHLIPPFCPPETAPRKHFAGSTRGIVVLGLSATTWDDCLSTIVDSQEKFTALACSDKSFAIGMSSGKVVIYDETTCQQSQALDHEEPVKILYFGRRIDILISAGPRKVRIWDIGSWEQVWEFKTPQPCVSLALIEENQLLLGALRNNDLAIWDLAEGTLRDTADWALHLEGPQFEAYRRPVLAASFCLESCLLAVVYRGQDILLWDLDRDELHDTFSKAGSSSLIANVDRSAGVTGGLVFSATPNETLLAAAYSDGDLVLFDILEGTVREKTLVNAQTLACSPDGRTLASGDSSGTIQLFDFENLRLLYRIISDEYCISKLAFTGDSHRLLDIRGSECRVWDPMVLVRQDRDEEISGTVSVSTAPQEVNLESTGEIVLITSMVCHPDSGVFFCGKEDGSVYLYETKSGRQTHKLFSHAKGVSILSLFFDVESNALSSTDSGRVKVHILKQGQEGWEAIDTLFEHRVYDEATTVKQVLTKRGATHVLICTGRSDTLWYISSKETSTVIETISWEERGAFRWATHPLNDDQLILISDNIAHLYEWKSLRRLTGDEGILLEGSLLPTSIFPSFDELAINSITPCFDNTTIATTFGVDSRPQSKAKLLLWNVADFGVESKSAAPIPKYHSLADQVKTLIGDDGRRLVFLSRDNWICSADPESANADHYDRHFFLPADWLSSDVRLMIRVAHDRDIVFVKRDEVAVIKRGLDNIEEEAGGKSGKRPSLLGREIAKRPSLKMPAKTL